MKALLVENEAGVPAGRVLEVLDYLRWETEVISIGQGGNLPRSLEGFDCLVILGGTMNVDDTKEYPHLETLRHLVAPAIDSGFPVMGICLGAQLLARAAGARVHKGKCGEIGWCSVDFSGEGLYDPVLEGVSGHLEVFQWHDDMFELPEKAILLAGSGQCPNQIMRIGKNAYGFQFHPEVTTEIIRGWINCFHDEVEERLGPGGAIRLINLTVEEMPLYHENCRRIFANFFKKIERRK